MRPQAQLIDFVLTLVGDPTIDNVLGEHIAFEQKIVIVLQSLKRLIQRTGKPGNICQLLRTEGINIPRNSRNEGKKVGYSFLKLTCSRRTVRLRQAVLGSSNPKFINASVSRSSQGFF